MDPETLDLIVNIVKWGSLGVLLFFVLILLFAGLIGLKRGIFNSAFRLIITAILVGVALATVRPITELIASSDLGGLMANFGLSEFSIELGEEVVVIQITSVYETLTALVVNVLEGFGVSISGAQAGEIVHGLVYMILSTVIVILDGILIWIFNGILATILYHLIFKHFISKRTRKKVRRKGLSFLMGSTRAFLVVAMLVFPFSSLINNVVGAFKDEKNGVKIDNEMINTVATIVDAYDSSVLANVFFNWTSNASGQTWDVSLMDYLTSADINGVKVGLVDELSNLVGIGKTLVSSGILDEGGFDALGQTIISSEEILGSLLTSVGNSGLVLVLIPVAIELALNLDEAKEFVGDDLIDISDIDWKKEIKGVHRMFQSIVRTGLLDELLDENGEFLLDETFFGRLFDLDTYTGIMNLFKAMSESKFLTRAISAVAYTMVTTNEEIEEFSSLLPSEWADYTKIDWGRELSIVYETFFRINAIDPSIFPALIDSGNNGDSNGGGEGRIRLELAAIPENTTNGAPYLAPDGDGDGDDFAFLEPLLANLPAFKQILIGRTDVNGNPLGVDEDGVTLVFDTDGKRILNRHYALFDSQLLRYSLEGTINLVVDSFFSEYNLDEDAINDLIDDLEEGTPLINYKKEFSALFDLLIIIGEDEAARSLLADPENSSAIEFDDDGNLSGIDEGLISSLKKAFYQLDKSRLLSLIIPTFLEDMFMSDEMAEMFEGFGLDPAKLNFKTPNLGHEFALLLDALDDIQALTSIMDPYQGEDGIDEDSMGDLLEDISANHEPIAHLLDTFYLSNIINERDGDGNLVHGDDSNFFGVIDFIFDTLLEGIGLTNKISLSSIPKWANSRTYQGDFRRNTNGEPVYDGENGYIVLFIKAIGESRLLEIIDVADGDSIDFGQLGGAVRQVFNAVDKSKLISATFGDVLDKYILSILSDDPGDVSFNNVTSWAVEGETFERLCNALDDFGGLDFTNIDFFGSDPDNVVNLLTTLSDSQMFDGPDGYLFGEFFYETLTSSLGGSLDLFYDPNATTTLELKKDFDSLDTRPLWHAEIEDLGDVIRALRSPNVDDDGELIDDSDDFDYFALLTSGDLTPDHISDILSALNNATTTRMVIYNAYAQIGSSFQSDQVDLSKMNNLPLVDMSKAQRQGEIDILVSMYKVIKDLGEEDVNGDYSYDMNLATAGVELVDNLRVALKELTGSAVFNTLSDDSVLGDETVFRQFSRLFVSAKVVETNIYNANNPKDIDGVADGYYVDGDTKIDYLLDKNFPTPTLDVNLDLVFVGKTKQLQEEYIDGMLDVFEALITLDDSNGSPYTPDGFDIDLNVLNEENFKRLFMALNDSEVYYDLVPNLIARVVHDEAAYQIDDIIIGAANPYFHYNGNEYDNRFPEGEIEELSDLFVLIKEFTDLIPSGQIDLSLLNDEIDVFTDTLIKFQETYTFHRGGSYIGGEITVFEQIIRKIYVDSHLAELAYEQVHDFNNSSSIDEAVIKNVTNEIVDFENYIDPLYGPSLNNGSWSNEIYAIADLIESLTSINIASGNLTSFDASSFTPSILDGILNAINKLDVVKDATPHLIKNALYNEAINFSRFTTYDVAKYNVDLGDFSGIDEITIFDSGFPLTLKIENVTESSGKLNFTSSGVLYNTTPINNIDSIIFEASNINNLTFYYGDSVEPDERYYIVEDLGGGSYKVDLSEVPYQYFQIKANASFTLENLEINQAIEIGEYMQDQVSYRNTNIPILISLLDEMFDTNTNDYFDFSTPEGALEFVDQGKTLAPVLAFITESDLYQKQITNNYKAESLLFYNLFSFELNRTISGFPVNVDAALGQNIRGATKEDKLIKINDLINNPKFDYEKEADALDYGLFSIAIFEGASQASPTKMPLLWSPQDIYLYNIATIDSSINYITTALESSRRGRLDSDFITNGYGPALLVSEIVGGQLNNILSSRYDDLDNRGVAYSPVDLYSNDYEKLVDLDEIAGFNGAVHALYYSLLGAPVSVSPSALEINAVFVSMYNQDVAYIIYLADIEPALNELPFNGGRNLGVTSTPILLSDFEDIAQALIASRGAI